MWELQIKEILDMDCEMEVFSILDSMSVRVKVMFFEFPSLHRFQSEETINIFHAIEVSKRLDIPMEKISIEAI